MPDDNILFIDPAEMNAEGKPVIRPEDAAKGATAEDFAALKGLRDRMETGHIEAVGDHFRLPPEALQRDVDYQMVSFFDWDKIKDAGGWKPTTWQSYFSVYRHCGCSAEGWVTISGLMLVERPKSAGAIEREDERVKAMVLETIAKRALSGNAALFDANTVRNTWQEAKAALDDVTFRRAHRAQIIERASKMAKRYGQIPTSLVSCEQPVPCRLEGLALWFFNEQRLIPIWRFFEPLAIAQLKDELKEICP